MPSSNCDTLWQEIKENTNAPEEYKDTCMMKVGDIWKKWKAEVKKMYFTPYEDDPEKLAEFPGNNRLRPDQWKDLVEYWQLEEVKENKEHREDLVYIHRTGRISFANIRYGMEFMNEDVSHVSVFLKTRQCPTNKPRHEKKFQNPSELQNSKKLYLQNKHWDARRGMDMSEHGALVHLLPIFFGQSHHQPLVPIEFKS